MNNSRVVSSGNKLCTKKEIVDMIDANFSSAVENYHDNIANITTIIASDGSIHQTITFSKVLE